MGLKRLVIFGVVTSTYTQGHVPMLPIIDIGNLINVQNYYESLMKDIIATNDFLITP